MKANDEGWQRSSCNVAFLSFPRRRESRKWENPTFYEAIKSGAYKLLFALRRQFVHPHSSISISGKSPSLNQNNKPASSVTA